MTAAARLLHWQQQWPKALAIWSEFTALPAPLFCQSKRQAQQQGLTESFAMIRLHDQQVVVDLELVAKYQLDDEACAILAHEIGHHVFAPANVNAHSRLIYIMRQALPTLEHYAAILANLYTDLLINHYLKAQGELPMERIYQKIGTGSDQSKVWRLYLSIYEQLWRLSPGTLAPADASVTLRADAWLGARIVKCYGRDWLTGASRFASLMLSYLVDDDSAAQANLMFDMQQAAQGALPQGLWDEQPIEVCHPSLDPVLTGKTTPVDEREQNVSAGDEGQLLEPFEYGEVLEAAGVKLSPAQSTNRYYRQLASRYLLPFPRQSTPQSYELLLEGVEPWSLGEDINNINWFASLQQSPEPIWGYTTVQNHYAEMPSAQQNPQVMNLDLYVDCSGSMPNPARTLSHTALAGCVLALSALRAGAAVQVTLWSGKRQFLRTEGYCRNEEQILSVLTGYLGGGTAFPLHILRESHQATQRQVASHNTLITVLSDDGISTLFDDDELANSGRQLAAQALENAGGQGILLLNLNWDFPQPPQQGWYESTQQMLLDAQQQGWQVYPVRDWSQMLAFVRQFSARYYQ